MLFAKLSSCICQTQNIHCVRCVAWKEKMGKERKVEAWITHKQKRCQIPTKQKNWSQFPAKQQKNLSVLCFKISGSSKEQFFFYWVLKCTQQTSICSLVRHENNWTFVLNPSANFYGFPPKCIWDFPVDDTSGITYSSYGIQTAFFDPLQFLLTWPDFIKLVRHIWKWEKYF